MWPRSLVRATSVLSLYRTLIALRNGTAALNSGRIEGVASNGRILGYERVDDGQRFAILLNFNQSDEEAPIAAGHIVVSTHMDRAGDAVESRVSLRPFEGVVVRLAVTGALQILRENRKRNRRSLHYAALRSG